MAQPNTTTTVGAHLITAAAVEFVDNTAGSFVSDWDPRCKFGEPIKDGDAPRVEPGKEDDGHNPKSTHHVGDVAIKMQVSEGHTMSDRDIAKLAEPLRTKLGELRTKPWCCTQAECFDNAHHLVIARNAKCAVAIAGLVRAGLSEVEAKKYAPTPRDVTGARGNCVVVDESTKNLIGHTLTFHRKIAEARDQHDTGLQAAAAAERGPEQRNAARDADRTRKMEAAAERGFERGDDELDDAWARYLEWFEANRPAQMVPQAAGDLAAAAGRAAAAVAAVNGNDGIVVHDDDARMRDAADLGELEPPVAHGVNALINPPAGRRAAANRGGRRGRSPAARGGGAASGSPPRRRQRVASPPPPAAVEFVPAAVDVAADANSDSEDDTPLNQLRPPPRAAQPTGRDARAAARGGAAVAAPPAPRVAANVVDDAASDDDDEPAGGAATGRGRGVQRTEASDGVSEGVMQKRRDNAKRHRQKLKEAAVGLEANMMALYNGIDAPRRGLELTGDLAIADKLGAGGDDGKTLVERVIERLSGAAEREAIYHALLKTALGSEAAVQAQLQAANAPALSRYPNAPVANAAAVDAAADAEADGEPIE